VADDGGWILDRPSGAPAVRRALALATADLIDLGGEVVAAVSLSVGAVLSGVLGAGRPGSDLSRRHDIDDRYGNVRSLESARLDGRRRSRARPTARTAAPGAGHAE
jgi:hypothetical protein